MANSAYQTAPGFIKTTTNVTLTAKKAKDIRIDGITQQQYTANTRERNGCNK